MEQNGIDVTIIRTENLINAVVRSKRLLLSDVPMLNVFVFYSCLR